MNLNNAADCYIRPYPLENSGSRPLSHRQASEGQTSSWVGDDQRIPGVVCFCFLHSNFFGWWRCCGTLSKSNVFSGCWLNGSNIKHSHHEQPIVSHSIYAKLDETHIRTRQNLTDSPSTFLRRRRFTSPLVHYRLFRCLTSRCLSQCGRRTSKLGGRPGCPLPKWDKIKSPMVGIADGLYLRHYGNLLEGFCTIEAH
jgi:hypothetical protein